MCRFRAIYLAGATVAMLVAAPFARAQTVPKPSQFFGATSVSEATKDRLMPSRSQANVLLITVAGLRPEDIERPKIAPTLAQLASESFRFENTRTTYPEIGAASASMLGGRYFAPAKVKSLKDELMRVMAAKTLVDRAQAAGLATAAVTSLPEKALARDRAERVTLRQGFKFFLNRPNRSGRDSVADAMSLIAAAKGKRFLMWFEVGDLVSPALSGDEIEDPQDRHDRRLAGFDKVLRKLLDVLQTQGQQKNTLIVLSSDQAAELGEENGRKRRRLLSERVIRIPLLFLVPGSTGRTIAHGVDLSDVAPTIGSLFGWGEPEGTQGQSLLPLLVGETAVVKMPASVSLSCIKDPRLRNGTAVAAVAFPWKIVYDAVDDRYRLYHLIEDETELQDLSVKKPRVLARMKYWLELAAFVWNRGSRGADIPPRFTERAVSARLRSERPAAKLAATTELRLAEIDAAYARGDEAEGVRLLKIALGTADRDSERGQALQKVLVYVPKGVLDEVFALAEHDNPTLRSWAALALGVYSADTKCKSLIAKLLLDAKPAVAAAAAIAAAANGDRSQREKLRIAVARGAYSDRVLATTALATLGDGINLRMLESLLLGSVLPRELDAFAWRCLNKASDFRTLPLRYLVTVGEEKWPGRQKLIIEGAHKTDAELSVPLLRSLVLHSDGIVRRQIQVILKGWGKSGWLARMQISQRRLVDFREHKNQVAQAARVAGFYEREFMESLAVGYTDWGLALEALADLSDRDAKSEAAELFGKLSAVSEEMPTELRGLFGRFEALAKASGPRVVVLSMGAESNRIRRSRHQLVWRVKLSLDKKSGALVGGPIGRGAMTAAVIRQSTQKVAAAPSAVPIPPLGILPGESVDLLLAIALKDLELAKSLAYVAVVDRGQPLAVIKKDCVVVD
ncbi:MAG: sulfatase-like hydrolase/transferase [Planctomycetota bacterium]